MKNTNTQANNAQASNTTLRRAKVAAYLMTALVMPTGVWAANLPVLAPGGISPGNAGNGTGQVSTAGDTMTVKQDTSKLIINWESFNIGNNKTVNFNQPDANSIVLNRVLGAEPSTIAGRLNANGQVFLTNQNGILFTSGAQVNVGGLVATTLAISDADFLNSNYRFQRVGTSTGPVLNNGTLNAHAHGGYIALLGDNRVANAGTITAHGEPDASAFGHVALLAGQEISLALSGKNLVSVKVDAAALHKVLVQNTGVVVTPNGQITMTARGSNQILDLAINNTGMVVATGVSINASNGIVSLDAGGGRLSLSAARNTYGGKTIWADSSLVLAGGMIDISGSSSAPQLISTGYLDATAVEQIKVDNVNFIGTHNQALRANNAVLLNNVNWSTQGTLTLRSFGGRVNLDHASLLAQDIVLNATQTVRGGGWGTGLGDAALVLSNSNLTARNSLTLNGQTTVTPTANGGYGAGGLLIAGTSNLKAKQATLTGSSNSLYQSFYHWNAAGITLHNNLGLDGQFSFTGTSNGGVPAFYMAHSYITLAKDTKVDVTALGNSDFKNLGLVGIMGANLIKGAGQFIVNAEAHIDNPAIFFYATTLAAAEGADVRFNAKNTGTGSAIATTSDVTPTTLKNIRLYGESSTKAGISITDGTQLEDVLLDGKSLAGRDIEIASNVLIYNGGVLRSHP